MHTGGDCAMKKILFALIIIPVQFVWAAGPDEMILWRYSSPIIPQRHYGSTPEQICREGPSVLLLYSNPYNIKSLNWNNASVTYGFGRWGVSGAFRSYSLDGLYGDYKSSLGFAYLPIKKLGISASIDYGKLTFGDDANYNRVDFNLGLSYSRKNLAGMLALGRINLKKPYDSHENIEPMILGSFNPGDGMIFTAGYKESFTGEGRWLFKQDIGIINGLGLELGYMNNPSILQWGLDLSWKSLNLSLGYHAVSRLNDTVVMGLSWGI
jgi:hypothetical protein